MYDCESVNFAFSYKLWPGKCLFRWSGRETRIWSTQHLTPILSSRLIIILSSKPPAWQTRATTRAWPKISSLAAKATPPQSWFLVGADSSCPRMSNCYTLGGANCSPLSLFWSLKSEKQLKRIILRLHGASVIRHFHINLCMLSCTEHFCCAYMFVQASLCSCTEKNQKLHDWHVDNLPISTLFVNQK